MTDETSPEIHGVASELQDHIDAVSQWADAVNKLTVNDCTKGVTSRFVRDCNTLIKDCQTVEDASTEDLIDLKDYRDMLEVRHHNLIQDNSPNDLQDDD